MLEELRNQLIIYICILNPFIIGGILFYYFDTRPSKRTRRKLKIISKIENKRPYEITERALELYIKAYEEQRKIDWGEYL